MNKEELLTLVINKFDLIGFNPQPGPMFILPDGQFLVPYSKDDDFDGTEHANVDWFLTEQGIIEKPMGDGSKYFTEQTGSIRVYLTADGGTYIHLGSNTPTEAQEKSLLTLLDYWGQEQDVNIISDIEGQVRQLTLEDTLPDDILKSIKRYYSTGILRESNEEQTNSRNYYFRAFVWDDADEWSDGESVYFYSKIDVTQELYGKNTRNNFIWEALESWLDVTLNEWGIEFEDINFEIYDLDTGDEWMVDLEFIPEQFKTETIMLESDNDDLELVTDDSAGLFNIENGVLIELNVDEEDKGSITSIVIPNGVKIIGEDAFLFCYSLKSVVIPNSVTEIDDFAFYSCVSLKSIVIPNSVTKIGGGAFYDCFSLKSIVIPNSTTKIDTGAFYGCQSLTIYCKASSQPEGWHKEWNPDDIPVIWGYKGKLTEDTDNTSDNDLMLIEEDPEILKCVLTKQQISNLVNYLKSLIPLSRTNAAEWRNISRNLITNIDLSSGIPSLFKIKSYIDSSSSDDVEHVVRYFGKTNSGKIHFVIDRVPKNKMEMLLANPKEDLIFDYNSIVVTDEFVKEVLGMNPDQIRNITIPGYYSNILYDNAYIGEPDTLNESSGSIKVYTYQRQPVLDILHNNQTYVADYSKGMFKTSEGEHPYKALARVLNLNNCPIFGSTSINKLNYMMDASGLDSDEFKLLTLNVPKSEIKMTDYYDWTDYIYYYIDEEEDVGEGNMSKEEYENYMRSKMNRRYGFDYPQVILDKIEPEWLIDNTSITEAKSDQNAFTQWAGEELAARFFRLKPRLNSPKNDIYYWMKNSSPDELSKILDELESKPSNAEGRKKAKEGAELIYSSSKWKVYKINTFEAAQIYGKHTKWCITGDDEPTYWWNYYTKEFFKAPADFYFYLNSFGDKFALLYCPTKNRTLIYTDIDNETKFIPEAPKITGLPDVSEIPHQLKSKIIKDLKLEQTKIKSILPSYEEVYDADHLEKYTIFTQSDDMLDVFLNPESEKFELIDDYKEPEFDEESDDFIY